MAPARPLQQHGPAERTGPVTRSNSVHLEERYGQIAMPALVAALRRPEWPVAAPGALRRPA